MHENRKISCTSCSKEQDRSAKAINRTADLNLQEKSDCAVVPVNQTNKEERSSAETGREEHRLRRTSFHHLVHPYRWRSIPRTFAFMGLFQNFTHPVRLHSLLLLLSAFRLSSSVSNCMCPFVPLRKNQKGKKSPYAGKVRRRWTHSALQRSRGSWCRGVTPERRTQPEPN
jgi:hypothetical protein